MHSCTIATHMLKCLSCTKRETLSASMIFWICNISEMSWLTAFGVTVLWLALQLYGNFKKILSPTVGLCGTVIIWQVVTWRQPTVTRKSRMLNLCEAWQTGESELWTTRKTKRVTWTSMSEYWCGGDKMAAGFHKVHFNMNAFQLLTVQFGLKCVTSKP